MRVYIDKYEAKQIPNAVQETSIDPDNGREYHEYYVDVNTLEEMTALMETVMDDSNWYGLFKYWNGRQEQHWRIEERE